MKGGDKNKLVSKQSVSKQSASKLSVGKSAVAVKKVAVKKVALGKTTAKVLSSKPTSSMTVSKASTKTAVKKAQAKKAQAKSSGDKLNSKTGSAKTAITKTTTRAVSLSAKKNTTSKNTTSNEASNKSSVTKRAATTSNTGTSNTAKSGTAKSAAPSKVQPKIALAATTVSVTTGSASKVAFSSPLGDNRSGYNKSDNKVVKLPLASKQLNHAAVKPNSDNLRSDNLQLARNSSATPLTAKAGAIKPGAIKTGTMTIGGSSYVSTAPSGFNSPRSFSARGPVGAGRDNYVAHAFGKANIVAKQEVDLDTGTAVIEEEIRFQVGDKIVYPGYGVGSIESIESREGGGTQLYFFRISILETGMKVFVPVAKAQANGLRRVVDSEMVDKVYDILRDRKIVIDTQTWNRRYREYSQKLKTGSVIEIAKVIRDLCVLKSDKELSFGERRMLDSAQGLLVREISIAKSRSEDSIREELSELLKLN